MRTFSFILLTSLFLVFISQNLKANRIMTNSMETIASDKLRQKTNGDLFKRSDAFLDLDYLKDYEFLLTNSRSKSILNDLTGEIVITEGGKMTEAYYGGRIEIYEYVDICYSGPEDVEYTIKVNGNVLNQYSAHWVDSIGGYRVYLSDMIQYGSDLYSVSCNFDIIVSAEGYNDLSTNYYTFFSFVPSPPTIANTYLTPTALIIDISFSYECSIHSCNLPAVNDEPFCSSYMVERLDYDYYVTVFASNRTLASTVSGFVEETLFVPARLYGDVDGSEYITLGDVTLLIDYLLGFSDSDFYVENADVNRDELITIADVTALIDKLLDNYY